MIWIEVFFAFERQGFVIMSGGHFAERFCAAKQFGGLHVGVSSLERTRELPRFFAAVARRARPVIASRINT